MKPSELCSARIFAIACAGLVAMGLFGCGTVQEGTTEDWVNTPPVSVTARLEYRIDSLINENRKLQQQFETVSSENRNLTARNTELESKLNEMSSAPRPTGTTTTPTPHPSATTGGYEAALARFRSRDFQGAVEQFNALLNGGIGSDLADNCHYWIGESYFGMKKYNDAIQHFEVVVGMQGSDKADDAQFMIGNSYASIGKKGEAKEAFQKLIAEYPSSPLIKRARTKMSTL